MKALFLQCLQIRFFQWSKVLCVLWLQASKRTSGELHSSYNGFALLSKTIGVFPPYFVKSNVKTWYYLQENTLSSESEDDLSVTIKSKSRGDRRKHQRMWTIDEVVKLLDGISHFGLGKWTDIKNSFFHSASHRTPVDIRVSFFTI